MANRNKRKQRYQNNVVGKIGSLDLVRVADGADHIINARGGKIYNDITKHAELEIPTEGKEYDVLSVGTHHVSGENVATIKSGDLVQVYRLPADLAGWVEHLRGASAMGIKLLPATVEFGKRENGTHYAEIK